MPKIVPPVLKRQREAKGWSQRELAEKARLDNQTICRLERGAQATTRPRTVQLLARVLGVEPAVLTGASAPPETEPDDDHFLMSRLSFRVSTQMHNALYLTAHRYHVSQREIVELAPFLFCCAAEASLRQRRDRLADAERACDNARRAEREMGHLSAPDFEPSEEKFAAEKQSLDWHDLFGWSLDVHLADMKHDWIENPFAVFLDGLADATDGVATLEGYAWMSDPEYCVCPEEAALLVNGDSDLAKEILEGHVDLNDMPKNLPEIGNAKERVEWLRGKLEEFRQESRRIVAEIDFRKAST